MSFLPTAGKCWPPYPWWRVAAKHPIFACKNVPLYRSERSARAFAAQHNFVVDHLKYEDREGEVWAEEDRQIHETLLGRTTWFWRGSCNDHVFIVWKECLKLGIKNGCFRAVTCAIKGEPKGHLVLAIETTETTLIADCRRYGVYPWDDPLFSRYEWRRASVPNEWLWRWVDK